jgi:hypothetical protein
MRRAQQSCERHIGARLAMSEQRFADVWRRLDQDDRRSLWAQFDLLGIEGELALCVRLSGGDWLELALDDEAARTGVRWVTYHVANNPDHAERIIYPEQSPALWRAAGQYLGRAMQVLQAQGWGSSR